MYYYDGHFLGMNFYWWSFWALMLFWIFVTPYDIPGQRSRRLTPLQILKKRFASGEITAEEYKEKKDVLEIKENA